jgi:hypothetical protein
VSQPFAFRGTRHLPPFPGFLGGIRIEEEEEKEMHQIITTIRSI